MTWICTDHDGTELLFDYRPVWVNLMKLTKKEIEELQPSNPEGEAFVTLVPGSTKKIIGRNLTWEDGPIEINDNMLPKKEILAYFKCLKEDWNEYTLAINSKNRTLSEYIRDYAN